MTNQTLVLIIFLLVLAQVAVFSVIAFYRHWLTYEELKRRLGRLENHHEAPPLEPVTPPAWEGFRDFRVQRKVFEDEHQNVCSFYLTPVDGKPLPDFKPGQYLTLQLLIPKNPKTLIRCYSLSDQPHREYYRITVKKIPPPHPGLASTYLHEQVQEGDILPIKPPSGHFYLADPITGPLVLIAGGIGITPLLSILHTALCHHPQREIWFYYGIRNHTEHLMKEHLAELAKKHPNLRLHICYSRPTEIDVAGIDYQHAGHLDITLLRLTLLLKLYHFYICGPQAMMENLVPALRDWGVAEAHIHYEAFGPASLNKPTTAAPTRPITITFSKTGKSVPWDSSATCLLEFAEAQGIPINSGCRAGSCGCCQTPLEIGTVAYHQTPDADLAPGTCLLCISTPKTDLTLSA